METALWPALCLDADPACGAALLWQPGAPLEESPRFLLPHGGALCILAPGVEAPETTAPEATPLPLSPVLESHTRAPAFPALFSRWRALLAAAGFAAPGRVAVAVDAPQPVAFWERFIHEEQGNLERLGQSGGDPLRPGPVQTALDAGAEIALPREAAALLGVLACPAPRRRTLREGVLVLFAEASRLAAFLVYAGRVWGAYLQDAPFPDHASLARILDDFRLGWLPPESVRPHGGAVALAPLPPEAEGFRPAFLAGPCQRALHGLGRPILPGGDARLAPAAGLGAALERAARP